MAFGFTPKYSENLPLENLSNLEFTTLALKSCHRLSLGVDFANEKAITAFTQNGNLSKNYEIRIEIDQQVARITSYSMGNEFFDQGKNKKEVARFIQSFQVVKSETTAEELHLEKSKLNTEFSLQASQNHATYSSDADPFPTFASYFKPRGGYFITPILISTNIAVFILMVAMGAGIMNPGTDNLILWGANLRSLTLDGQYWRLLTCCFVHIGVVHLLMNMYALVYVGILLEPLLGRVRFLAAYLLTGIIASTASLWWHDNTISAGASGAVFGMYGVFIALLSTKLIEPNTRKALLSSIGLFVVFSLVYGMQGGVDNAAHIGGLVSGLIVGYLLVPSVEHPEKKKRNSITLSIYILTLFSGVILACKITPNDVGDYLKKNKEIISLQEDGMSYLKLLNKSEDEEIIHEIDTISYPSWEKALRLITESEQLKVSNEVSARLPRIKAYYQYRERQCFFIRDYLVSSNEDSKMQAQLYSQKADSVVKLLNED
jgi:rhomboid protease GluP